MIDLKNRYLNKRITVRLPYVQWNANPMVNSNSWNTAIVSLSFYLKYQMIQNTLKSLTVMFKNFGHPVSV